MPRGMAYLHYFDEEPKKLNSYAANYNHKIFKRSKQE